MGVWRTAVQITGGMLPDPAANIWHIRTGQEVGDATYADALQDAMDAIGTFYDTLKTSFGVGCRMEWDGTATELDTDTPRVADGLTGFSVLSGGDSSLPAADALIVQWRTSLATRRGRGRTFLGPLTRGAIEDNGTPTEPKRAEVLAAAQALVDASSGTNAPPWAVGVWSPTDKVLRDFTGCAVPNVIASIRSRRD